MYNEYEKNNVNDNGVNENSVNENENENVNAENVSEVTVSDEITESTVDGGSGDIKEEASFTETKADTEVTEPVEEAKKEPSPVCTATGEATYNPQSDSYSYSKSESNEHINGCVWDKTSAKPEKKASSKGFKVFVAVIACVFTVSVASIAAFMAFDYAANRNLPVINPSTGTNTINPDNDSQNLAEVIPTTFKTVEGDLTKSQVAAKCSPSAVGIVTEMKSSGGGYYDFGFFGNYYSSPQIVQGAGSGFIYNAEGYIITNHHVIDGAEKITVHLSNKTEVEAELVGSDSFTDIAVIKINPEGLGLIPMEIGDSSSLVVGDEVIAIGCPAGIEYMGTVTDGIISAINRDISLNEDGTKKTMTLLQTNATINKGNSGGPLINSKGQVIGINTLKLSSNYEGIGFSIPINGAIPVISQLIEHGEVIERSETDFVSGEGVIGISASAITESEAEYYDIPMGVLVVQINKDGSAARAGLRRGDIITAFNGKTVKTVQELNNYKASFKAGDEVTLTVYRDADDTAEEKTFDITFKLDTAS